MKLLIVTHSLGRGGAEKLIIDSIPYFLQMNVEVELLLFDASKSVPKYLESVKGLGVKVTDCESPLIYQPFISWKVHKFLRKNQFDIIHVHLFPALYWVPLGIFGLNRKPYLVYTEHNNTNDRRSKWYFKGIEKIFYNFYDKIIGITESVSDNLIAWIGQSSRIVTIENGVDVSTIQKAEPYPRDILCKELGIEYSNSLVLMLMTASFRYPKDQSTIIRAINLLGDNYHLLLAGEGGERKNVEELVDRLSVNKRVHFLGFRTDNHSLMKSVDINVLSSDFEGMSGVTLEALISRKVFLGSDVDGIKEIVKDQRALFPAGDCEYLADLIKTVIDNQDLYNELVELGRRKAEKFDMSLMVKRYVGLYYSLI